MDAGELISFYRKQSGMTIDELVEKSCVPKGTLNKIINGVTKAPTLDNMKAIAHALGKTPIARSRYTGPATTTVAGFLLVIATVCGLYDAQKITLAN